MLPFARRPRFRVALALLLVGQLAHAKNGVSFTYPPERGLVFHFLDTINVTYRSPFAKPLLYTFCQTSDGIKQEYVHEGAPFDNSSLVYLNFFNNDGVCWFDLRPNASAGGGDNSPNFQILEKERPSKTTLGLAQPSATGSGAGNSTNDGAGSGNQGLSAGAKAGIGVGVALGVIGIGCLAAALWYHRRKAGKKQADGGDANYGEAEKFTALSPEAQYAGYHPGSGPSPGSGSAGFSEMPVEQASSELPATDGHRGYGAQYELAGGELPQHPEPHGQQGYDANKFLANDGRAEGP